MRNPIKDWLLAAGATCILTVFAATLRGDFGASTVEFIGRSEPWKITAQWIVAVVIGGVGWVLAAHGLRRCRRFEAAACELAKAQRQYQQSELWRRLLSENLPLGLLEYDREGRIVHSNERLRTLAGHRRETLEGRRVEELIPGVAEIVPHVVGLIELDRVLRTVSAREIWVRLQIVPVSDASGGICGGLVTVSDITDQKKHELEQEQLRNRLSRIASEWQATFDEVESPILILDSDDRLQRMNRAAMELTGRPYTASLGCRLEDIGEREPWLSLRVLVDRVREGEEAQTLQVHDDPDTGRSWDLTAHLVRRPVTTTAMILIARETTALVALQRSVQHSELMSAMGALVAGVAHEVRNPLFGISTTLDAFEARLGAENPHRGFIQVLRTEVNRMGDLMSELLDYGRPLELNPSMETLRSVIFEAIEHCDALTVQRGVTVKVEIDRDLPAIRMDRHHMVQVFKNLVANAVQHSPRHGEVRVRLEGTEDGLHRCTIRDHGEGFAEDALDRIFEPFYSKRHGGVGLGLSIVQRFVIEQGGSVRAFNHPEGGAVVEVNLPLNAAAPVEPAYRLGGKPGSGRAVQNTDGHAASGPVIETEEPRHQPDSCTEPS
jgi:PAS domain S-box-containing protein